MYRNQPAYLDRCRSDAGCMAYDGPTVARIKNGKIHGSFSLGDIFNFLQGINQLIQHHGITAAVCEFSDTLQVFNPGP